MDEAFIDHDQINQLTDVKPLSLSTQYFPQNEFEYNL